MEKQPLIEKVITISGFEQPSQTQYKIKDEHGLTYSFWSTKQDGSQTKAYLDWHQQALGVGMTIGIAYVESPNPQNAEHPYRNIRAFAPADDIKHVQNDGRPQYTGQSPKQFAKTTTPQQTTKDDNYNALGRCRHAFLLEAYKMGKHLDSELVTTVNGWAEVSMTGEMPEGNRPINADDIPF